MTGPIDGRGARAAAVLLLVWTLGVTVLRAARWPNDFAEAHWLLDYRLGPLKRGLAGEVLGFVTGLVGARPTESLIAGLSAAIFAALVLLLLFMAIRIVVRAAWSASAVLVAGAFLSSSYVVMASHLMGYLDHLVVLLTGAALVLALRGRIWWAFGSMAVAVLVHENTLVFGLPIAALTWLLSNDARRTSGGPRLPWLPLALPLVAFGMLAVSGARMSQDVFQDTFARHLESFPFVGGDMHLLVPEWLTGTVVENATRQSHRFVERLTAMPIYGLMLPTTLALLGLGLDRFVVRSRLLAAVLVLAVLSPQLLHMAGWDTVRIWTFTIAAALLACWVLAESCEPRRTPVSPSVAAVATTAIVVNVVSATPLYDNLAEWYDLGARVGMYAPLLLGCLWLLVARPAVEPGSASEGS